MSETPQQRHPGSVRLGTVVGAPVWLSYSWFGFAALVAYGSHGWVASALPQASGVVTWGVTAVIALSFLIAVLLHEIAHAIAANSRGLRVHAVVADLMGGHTTYDGADLRPGSAALVAAAGPLTNVVIGVGCGVLAQFVSSPIPYLLIYGAAVTNVLLGVFNLLPGLPMDGGQILEAVVWAITKRRSIGTRVAGITGLMVAAGVAVWLVVLPAMNSGLDSGALWGMLVSFYLAQGAFGALQRSKINSRLEGRTVDSLVHRLPYVDVAAPVAGIESGLLQGAIAVRRGAPVGLVAPGSVQQVPPGLRASTTVEMLLVAQPENWIIDAAPTDPVTDVLTTMARRQLAFAAVVHDGRIVGLVEGKEVNQLLSGS